jgi:hypothetical protein
VKGTEAVTITIPNAAGVNAVGVRLYDVSASLKVSNSEASLNSNESSTGTIVNAADVGVGDTTSDYSLESTVRANTTQQGRCTQKAVKQNIISTLAIKYFRFRPTTSSSKKGTSWSRDHQGAHNKDTADESVITEEGAAADLRADRLKKLCQ